MIALDNGMIRVEIDDRSAYRGTRFDHTLLISQVCLKGHTFLGIERTPAGTGTGGRGLYSGWLWKKQMHHNGAYPMPGIGWLDVPCHSEYSIRENYPYRPASFRTISRSDTDIAIESSMEGFCRVIRQAAIEDASLTITTTLFNDSPEAFDIEEYCHDFFMFGNQEINEDYKVRFSSIPAVKMVRGRIGLKDKEYSPLEFDEDLGTIAFSIDEGMPDTTEIRKGRCAVSITEGRKPSRSYHWISRAALCPESYQSLLLKPGESGAFSRIFTFHAE